MINYLTNYEEALSSAGEARFVYKDRLNYYARNSYAMK